jgi:membrane protease YdiL (CAAX protease family)
MEVNEQQKRLSILIVLSSIFLLNDFLFMSAKTYVSWLGIDYGSRFLAIGIVVYLIKKKSAVPAEFGLARIPFRAGLRWALLLTVTGIFIDQVVWRFFEHLLPGTQLASMPRIKNPIVNIVDLTFGILLVAVSEEIVFRGYCFTALRDRMGTKLLISTSAVLFGLIHWSTGQHAIITTALWGVMPMVAMIRTGSVVPGVVAHYITDLVSLGGFIPERWFDFIT